MKLPLVLRVNAVNVVGGKLLKMYSNPLLTSKNNNIVNHFIFFNCNTDICIKIPIFNAYNLLMYMHIILYCI